MSIILDIYAYWTDADFCRVDPCLNGATCSNGVGGFQCECAHGFTGGKCETG